MDLGRVIVITRRVTTIPIQVTECICRVITIYLRVAECICQVITIYLRVTECICWVVVQRAFKPQMGRQKIYRRQWSAAFTPLASVLAKDFFEQSVRSVFFER